MHFRVLDVHTCRLALSQSPTIRYGRNVVTWHGEADYPAFPQGDNHGEVLLTIGQKKKRAEGKEAANKKRAWCDHYDHPIWMMVLWGKYQARCLGCETAGPMVDGGPWAAQKALYAAVSVRPD